MTRSEEIIDVLKSFITPKCELDFNNNYELICAVMLSAQTTDKKVNTITPLIFEKYDSFKSLSEASPDILEPIIRPIGMSKIKSKNLVLMAQEVVRKFNENLPSTLEELVTLPGVGRKTASVVLALGFNIPAFPVDTHVDRVAKRLGMAFENDNVLEVEKTLRSDVREDMWIDAHHLMLLFGRYFCTSKRPKCDNCKVKKYCKQKW